MREAFGGDPICPSFTTSRVIRIENADGSPLWKDRVWPLRPQVIKMVLETMLSTPRIKTSAWGPKGIERLLKGEMGPVGCCG